MGALLAGLGGASTHQVFDLGRGTGDPGVTQFGVARGNAPLLVPPPQRTPGPGARSMAKDIRAPPPPPAAPAPRRPQTLCFSALLPAWRGC